MWFSELTRGSKDTKDERSSPDPAFSQTFIPEMGNAHRA